MLHFIKAMIRAGLRQRTTLLISAYLCLLLASSLIIMMVEPEDSALSRFGDALWWSVVTSTTVGYGDLYPVSGPGRITAVLLPMFMGIGLGAAFITHMASYLIERRDRKMHGEVPYEGSRHILVVGFTEETESLIREIRKDETYADQEIVLLADMDRHPLPDIKHLSFVRGRPDTLQALEKARTVLADRIIIHTGSDETSLFALINCLKMKSRACEITVRCVSTHSLDTFSSVPGEFEVIIQMTAEMMVQAMQDRVHIPLQILLRNNDENEIYFITLPKIAPGKTWWELLTYLKETYGYLCFALQTPEGKVLVNPDSDQIVSKGSGIWLLAGKRPVNIAWPS